MTSVPKRQCTNGLGARLVQGPGRTVLRAAVAADPVLRPLYPTICRLRGGRDLCGFLIQYWGGPDDYSAERGHPACGCASRVSRSATAERDAWYGHMSDGGESRRARPGRRAEMLEYFANAATHLDQHRMTGPRAIGLTWSRIEEVRTYGQRRTPE